MANFWIVGVAMGIAATLSGTIGKQLIRLSELLKVSAPTSSWIVLRLGLLINTVLGPVLSMGAYYFAPQSLIAPLAGLEVVWNNLLAPIVLKEKVTRVRLMSAFQILAGAVICTCFGNHIDQSFTLSKLVELLLNVKVLVYMTVFAARFMFNKFCLMKNPPGSAWRGISLGCTAGSLAGNMFCMKASLSIISCTFAKNDFSYWSHWLPYLLLCGAPFFAIFNLFYMTRVLREYEALFMISIYEGAAIVSGCISGTVILNDMNGLGLQQVAIYWLGVGTILLGMYSVFWEAVCKPVAGKLESKCNHASPTEMSGLRKSASIDVDLEQQCQGSSRTKHAIPVSAKIMLEAQSDAETVPLQG